MIHDQAQIIHVKAEMIHCEDIGNNSNIDGVAKCLMDNQW